MMHVLNSSVQLIIILSLFAFIFVKSSKRSISLPARCFGVAVFLAFIPFSFNYKFISNLFFEAAFSDNQFFREYFSWKGPNFQESPELQIAVILFLIFSYFSAVKDIFVRIFSYFSFFLFFFYQPAIILFCLALSVSAASFYDEVIYSRYKSKLFLFILIILLPIIFYIKNNYYKNEIIKIPLAVQDVFEKDKDEGDICLFYNLNLESYFDLKFANCILLSNQYQDYPQAFASYKKIVTFADGWQDEVKKQELNYLLAFEDEPLYGMFRDVLGWKEVGIFSAYAYKERGLVKQSKLILLKNPIISLKQSNKGLPKT